MARWCAGVVEAAFGQLSIGGLVFVVLLAGLLWSNSSQRRDMRALASALLAKGSGA